MKNLMTAAALSLSTLLAAQACLAEESPAFIAHQQAQLQQQHEANAERHAQSPHTQQADQQG
ncbi:hypothetical protein [Ectopseudomonas khazarica]|uniref:hypothetical protein n=1 Tax=Ectopseudomonas khazarica TaxID=2502979 RepID=UPI002FE0A559